MGHRGLIRKAVLSVPFAVLTVSGVFNITNVYGLIIMGLSGFLLWALIYETYGRILALSLSLVLWIGFAIPIQVLLSKLFPFWLSYIITGGILLYVVAITYRIAITWGQERLQARTAHGKPIIEWEWVYTGRNFAREHPLGQVSFGIYLTFGFLLLSPVVPIYFTGLEQIGALAWGIVASYAALLSVTFLLALKRHPLTYPLTIFMLALEFPLTVPFIMYWVDGVRPNLVYRHRFERLVLPKKAGGEK